MKKNFMRRIKRHIAIVNEGRKFKTRLKKQRRFANNGDSIIVLVCPWPYYPAVFFMIEMGLLLGKYGNKKVTFLVNDLYFTTKCKLPLKEYITQLSQIMSLKKCLEKVDTEVVLCSSLQRTTLSKLEEDYVEKAALMDTIRRFGSSSYSNDDNWIKTKGEYKNLIREQYEHMKTLDYSKYDRCVILGGNSLEAGVLYDIVKDKIGFITYDANKDGFFVGINALAGRCANIPEIYDKMSEKEMLFAEQGAEEIINIRKGAQKDVAVHQGESAIQTVSYDDYNKESHKEYDVIMFLNIEDDIAALGTHTLFQDDYEWVKYTAEYILKETDLSLAIREHPAQRNWKKTKMREFIKNMNSERIDFISAEDKVNSYSLIENSKLVIVATSTIGIEAAILGKTVLLETDCYYANSKFVKKASSINEYSNYIKNALYNNDKIDEIALKQAKIYYYLTQMCGSKKTLFNPHNIDNWIKYTDEQLIEKKEINIILKCIMDFEPLQYVIFKEEMMTDAEGTSLNNNKV